MERPQMRMSRPGARRARRGRADALLRAAPRVGGRGAGRPQAGLPAGRRLVAPASGRPQHEDRNPVARSTTRVPSGPARRTPRACRSTSTSGSRTSPLASPGRSPAARPRPEHQPANRDHSAPARDARPRRPPLLPLVVIVATSTADDVVPTGCPTLSTGSSALNRTAERIVDTKAAPPGILIR